MLWPVLAKDKFTLLVIHLVLVPLQELEKNFQLKSWFL
jgi:hypothetical protein